jgi:riboflavin biosynthesis pyrimidine reductase
VEVVWYTAMSMDGRIASADHSLAFLDTVSTESEFDEFIAGVDGVLLGASTLRWLIAGGHGWPHADLPTWLVSHDASLAQPFGLARVEGDLAPALDAIEAHGCRRVWLAGGGSVAAQVLALDRLTEVVATVAPTALGAGPALFDAPDLPLRTFDLVDAHANGTAARLRWRRS